MEDRIEELRPMADEFQHLQMCAYMLDEGLMEIDQFGGLYVVEEASL